MKVRFDALTIRRENRLEYEHRPNVVPMFRNRDDAILQARTSAIALETDRMEMMRDRVIRELGALIHATRRKEEELTALNAALGRLRG